jgi:hypothetical protein
MIESEKYNLNIAISRFEIQDFDQQNLKGGGAYLLSGGRGFLEIILWGCARIMQ